MDDFNFEIKKDFGSFGEGKWSKHLTLTSWNGKEAKYDIRPWNSDMTKMSRGITLTDAELLDLHDLIEEALGIKDSSSENSEDSDDFEDNEEFESTEETEVFDDDDENDDTEDGIDTSKIM